MGLKIGLIFGVLILGIFLINFGSSLTYDCEFRQLSACTSPFNNIVFKASDLTNSHGAIYTQSNADYDYGLCCNFLTSRPAQCTTDGGDALNYVDNRTIILSSTINAHAENPQPTSVAYSNPVCYGNLECIQTSNQCPGEYPIDAYSLSSDTNAHLASFDTYPLYNVCCKNLAEPCTQTCTQLGGTICTAGQVCAGGNFQCSTDSASNCCVGGNCCTVSPNACDFTNTWQCGSVQTSSPQTCGQTISCGPGNTCTGGQTCNILTHQCDTVCVPSCTGKFCGELNGCGGTCTSCPNVGESCIAGVCMGAGSGCVLGEATWEKGSAMSGELVWLNVTGSVDCEGEVVSFNVHEDSSGDVSDPIDAVFQLSGGVAYARTNWTAQYIPESDNQSEFYFIADETGGQAIDSRDANGPFKYLNVSSTSLLDIQVCDDYTPFGSQTCIADAANVANDIDPMCTDLSCPWNCGCYWNGTTCGSQTGITYCSGGNVSSIGMCSLNTEDITDCVEGQGVYTISWSGIWNWDFTNMGYDNSTTCEAINDPDGSGGIVCVQDANNLKWYYDPLNDALDCSEGSNVLECPAEIQLPFFNLYNSIAVLGLIALGYFIFRRK